MPAKYKTRTDYKRYNTYNKILAAVHQNKTKSAQIKAIKKNLKGSNTLNLSDKDIRNILKIPTHTM